MKNILYIVISSQTGGVPIFVLNALHYAKERKVRIMVAAPDDGEFFAKFQESAADTINLPLKPYSLSSLWKLRKYIKKNNIQLIHSHGKGAGMYARPLKLLCPGIKVVHTFHGIYLEEYGPALALIYKMIERSLKYLTDVVICLAQSERKEALKQKFVFRKKMVIIPNGVEPERFLPDGKEKQHYAAEFGLSEDSYIVGCVARLEYMKGHQYLLLAFKMFLAKYPDSYLFLVGDGPEREALKQQIKKLGITRYVKMVGFRKDIPGLLHYFDLFVSASLKEGMPFTILEALASETPVTATRVIGNQDILQHKYNGLLVEAMNSEELYRGMCYAKEHPDEGKIWARNGKKTIKKYFTVQRSLEKTFNVYERLLINIPKERQEKQ